MPSTPCNARRHATRLPGSPGSVDEEVDLLLHRQGHYVTGQVRAIHVILDESAITRFVARPDLMRGQLQHLLDRVEQGHTVVQLIPHEVGAHVGLDGAFHILGFPGDAEPNSKSLRIEVSPTIAGSAT